MKQNERIEVLGSRGRDIALLNNKANIYKHTLMLEPRVQIFQSYYSSIILYRFNSI